jgi:methylated-DNA-[protein]-cysteine S-methyltransferase
VSRSGFALFETAVGRCGLAWGPGGLAGVHLPEASGAVTMARLWRRFPGMETAEPPPEAAAAIARITAFLAGAPDDFLDLRLDFAAVGAFDRAVYAAARAIPAVGQALARNPWPILVPCHRITAAEGRMGGFSAPGGQATKLKLLEIEGALAAETLPLFGGPG